jgi:acyl-[acyl carrier protein]--UDP-N-acetylglucosamine O-acyltransferase
MLSIAINRRRGIEVDKKFRGIVDELLDYAPSRDTELFIESRGQQVIASALNLVRLIRESFDEETANDLRKRLVRAIATEDQSKFTRRLRAIRESKMRTV